MQAPHHVALGDEQLVDRVRAGDPVAFASLVHRYSGRLYGLARGMLRDEQDARDVVQETFLHVHRRLDGFRGDSSFRTWLFRIATNAALMRLRRRRRKPESSLDEPAPWSEGDEGGPREVADLRPLADQVHQDRELGEQIRAAVQALPETYREVLLLADYQQLSMLEIAQVLGISVPNVKTRLHRARLAVRASLRTYMAGER